MLVDLLKYNACATVIRIHGQGTGCAMHSERLKNHILFFFWGGGDPKPVHGILSTSIRFRFRGQVMICMHLLIFYLLCIQQKCKLQNLFQALLISFSFQKMENINIQFPHHRFNCINYQERCISYCSESILQKQYRWKFTQSDVKLRIEGKTKSIAHIIFCLLGSIIQCYFQDLNKFVWGGFLLS